MAVPCNVSAPPVLIAQQGLEDPAVIDDVRANVVSFGSSSTLSPRSEALKSSFTAPKMWMVVVGATLAVCAGAVNAVASRSLGVEVSHVAVMFVGMRIEGLTTGRNMHWDVIHSMLLTTSFVFGAFLCGLIIPKIQVHFSGKSLYGVALLGNSFLLVTAACIAPHEGVAEDHVLQPDAVAADCLMAMACGLQNAMCTMHFGAIVRTTHVTGTVTDIGSTAGRASMILLMRRCRRRNAKDYERMELRDDVTKILVLLPILAGFLGGSTLGAFLDTLMGIHALFVPAMVTGTTGLLYTLFGAKMRQQLKKLEERRLRDEINEMETALQRAQALLMKARRKAGRENLEDVNDIIGKSLRVIHDVESTVAGLGRNSRVDAAGMSRAQTM